MGLRSWCLPVGCPVASRMCSWPGMFFSCTPGLTIQWQWAAAVYKNSGFLAAGYEGLGVKPVDDNKASIGTRTRITLARRKTSAVSSLVAPGAAAGRTSRVPIAERSVAFRWSGLQAAASEASRLGYRPADGPSSPSAGQLDGIR